VAPYINVKSLIGLSQSPKVDVAATTGYKDVTLGASASYDTMKSDVTAWSVVAGLHLSLRYLLFIEQEFCVRDCWWDHS
jgi:hypothetical protein